MIFNSIHKIGLVCSRGENTRYCSEHVHYNPVKKQLEATNGRMAVVVPVEETDGDTEALIPAEMFRGKSGSIIHISTTPSEIKRYEHLGGFFKQEKNTFVVPNEKRGLQFPDISSAFPQETPTVRLAINAALLYQLAQAIGSDGVMLDIILTPEKGKQSWTAKPIVVRPYDDRISKAVGIIAPIKPHTLMELPQSKTIRKPVPGKKHKSATV